MAKNFSAIFIISSLSFFSLTLKEALASLIVRKEGEWLTLIVVTVLILYHNLYRILNPCLFSDLLDVQSKKEFTTENFHQQWSSEKSLYFFNQGQDVYVE